MQAIITKFKTLEVTMEKASHETDDCSRYASDVAALIEKIFNILWNKGFIFLFSATKQPSCTLHSSYRGINVDDSFMAVNACLQTLQRL